MDIAQSTSSKTAAKPQLSPYQEGVAKALKQAGEAHVMEAVQAGVPPQHIEQQAGLVDPNTLNQLMKLAGTPVQSKSDGTLLGDKVGVLPAILKTLTGTPTSPFQNKTEPLGLNGAIQLAGYQQTANKNNMDAQKFPFDMQKLIGDLLTQSQQYNQNATMYPLQQKQLEGQLDLQPIQKQTAEVGLKQANQNLEQGSTQAKLAYDKEQQNIKDNAGNNTNSSNAANTAQSLFDIRNSIKMKGPYGGDLLGTAVDFVQGGTEKRSDYNSTVNQFVFDVGTLLGQKGRAFSEKEQDLVRKQILNAGLSKSDDAFRGSMKAVFRRINNVAGEEIISLDKKGKVVMKQPAQSADKSSLQVGATGKAKDGTPVTWDGKNWVG